jgi:hypothetical protein
MILRIKRWMWLLSLSSLKPALVRLKLLTAPSPALISDQFFALFVLTRFGREHYRFVKEESKSDSSNLKPAI